MSTTTIPQAPVRHTDPDTSRQAAAGAKPRWTVARAIEAALEAHGRPLTADQIHQTLRYDFGFVCSIERVRTVLNEGAGLSRRVSARFDSFRRLDDTAPSGLGNPAHLWTLAGEA